MSSDAHIPQGFWTALAAVFAILFLLLLIKGILIGAIVALAAAVWTGFEAAGRGPVSSRS
jgi:hypothetical protein